ncbi:MAG: S9 family peptidase [Sphingomonadaceae bacterium]|nr:S9 family peptidase [Sphingomonadaceae bacterium]
MRWLVVAAALSASPIAHAAPKLPLQPADVFALQYATDARISPDGRTVAYVRRSFDIQTDRARSNIWLIDVATGEQRPLLSGTASYSSPRWSPDGRRLAYVTAADRDAQVYVRWMETGVTARVTDVGQAPSSLAWSPDGSRIAFTMFSPDPPRAFAVMPQPPRGAAWAAPPKVIDRLDYRADGAGYAEQGTLGIYVVPADGGPAMRVTDGAYDDGDPVWSADGRRIVFSADRHPDRARRPDPELYAVDLGSGALAQLTDRRGPDLAPTVSPDGRQIAWLGYDDKLKAYQRVRLYVANVDGSNAREVATGLDRDLDQPAWAPDGRSLIATFDDEGVTRLARIGLDGRVTVLASNLGGNDLGRPYGGVDVSVAARSGAVAFTMSEGDHPGDVAVAGAGGAPRRLTHLNDWLFGVRALGAVEPLPVTSADGTRVGAWIVKPPGFRADRKYPLILEIHGGPFQNYGPRFSVEMQAYAAAGYVVVYANPRGSTSYGEAYANAIDKNYPGPDYGDLMAAVDAALAKGFVDPKRLFVTGGSGGGVLTAWIVGKTDRFRAAVAVKPVINWTSWALTADVGPSISPYWLGPLPWAPGAQAQYWQHSPLSLVGNVRTPTMVLTGESDYRTPIAESEQYFAALKLAGVETAMVRVPDIGHALVTRPSQLIAKTQYILAWFARFDDPAISFGTRRRDGADVEAGGAAGPSDREP